MIIIVDYGMGNLGSIANMLKKVGAAAIVTGEPSVVERADKLILPGVGAFDNGMRNLTERGLVPVLKAKAMDEKVPILGLCLGMQLFTKASEEGHLPGLGWLDAETVRFRLDPSLGLKVPHMGWNTLELCRSHPALQSLGTEPRFYFVHSYYVVCNDPSLVLARTEHGYPFASAIAAGNIIGVQFHPEKSHRFGMSLLKDFAERA